MLLPGAGRIQVAPHEIRALLPATPGADGLGESTLCSGAASQAGTSERPAAGSGFPSGVRQSEGPRRWWWLGALLVVASLVVGGAGPHTVDQPHAQRGLYDS